MEEDRDDLDNLFDEYESNDPQPQENENNENAENEAVPEKVAVPKRVLKPRLKFNPERLCGKKGIPVLVDHFKDAKFKGKGHEKEDLKKLLTTLELWTHRLFPSMKFEDCLRQIEHLGKKRPVKTCVLKIRNDFPILDKDFVHNEDEEEEQEQPNELEPEPPAQDAFDRLFADYQESAQPVITSTPSSSQTVGNVLGTSFGAGMTEEQKRRMEYNKMLAIERRRKARESAAQSSNLINSTDTENTTNAESVLNSPPSERRDNNNPNFLFEYLQQQFTNTEGCSVNKKNEERSSQSTQPRDLKESVIMESVDGGGREETENNMLPNVRNNGSPEGIGKEELGLDELMDLVDDDERDNGKSCFKNDAESDKNETVSVALSDVKNNDASPVGSGKEELGLDELMDLVDEGDKDETGVDTVSRSKNNDKGEKDEVDQDALSNVENNDCPEGNSKEELEFDELMDLLDEEHQDKKDCDEKTSEIDAGFQDQHAEKSDDEL